jgi:DNA polymerase
MEWALWTWISTAKISQECWASGERGNRMRIEDLIEDLNHEIRGCNKCKLAETRTNTLSGEGNLRAKLMLIAQAPGENEDREGRMFIGPSGKVLDEILAIIHIDRKEIYMTNLIKCVLPRNRRPRPEEIEICSQYLDREIEVINPRMLASLGYYATRYVFEKYAIALPSKLEFHGVCGKVLEAGDKEILPLQHPAALLYNSSIKGEMVQDYSKMRIVFTNHMEESD